MSKEIDKNSNHYKIIKEIIESDEFQKRKEYRHHGEISVFEHSLSVSICSYNIACKINSIFRREIVNKKNMAIAGILHDFYYNDYTKVKEKKSLFKKHGFVHAREALENSKKFFPNYMNEHIENTILRHMFPLNITPPKYIEGWIIVFVDKIVSLEVFPYLIKKLVRSI